MLGKYNKWKTNKLNVSLALDTKPQISVALLSFNISKALSYLSSFGAITAILDLIW